MKYFLPFLITISFILAGCSASSRFTKKEEPQPKETPKTSPPQNINKKEIRAALTLNLQETLSFNFPIVLAAGGKDVLTLAAGSGIKAGISGDKVEVSVSGKRIVAPYVDISIKNIEDKLIYNNTEYRGYFRLAPYQNSIMLLNILDVEDYVRGVMVPELGVANRPEDFEALKAFAICVRTYAFMKMKAKGVYYDVRTDVSDQVYRGYTSEREFSNRAVEETKNTVLVYSGDLADIFYYSTCGGFTEDAANIFSKDIPYMRSVNDGSEPYCAINPSFNWIETYSGQEITNMLAAAKLIESSNALLKNIEIENRFPSGRVKTLLITVEENGTDRDIRLIGQQTRTVIRSKTTGGILRSLNLEISSTGMGGPESTIKITGKGNGHGVGFCQWGAIGRSRAGQNFKQILFHYFPGTRLGKAL